MSPALVMLEALPRKFQPLTFQKPPRLLLKVPDDSETLPVIVPVLLMMMPPLNSASARLYVVFPNNPALTVPLLVKIADCVLALLIWTTELWAEPSALITPAL